MSRLVPTRITTCYFLVSRQASQNCVCVFIANIHTLPSSIKKMLQIHKLINSQINKYCLKKKSSLKISVLKKNMLDYTSTERRREAITKTRTFLTLLRPSSLQNLVFQQDNKHAKFTLRLLVYKNLLFKAMKWSCFSPVSFLLCRPLIIRYYCSNVTTHCLHTKARQQKNASISNKKRLCKNEVQTQNHQAVSYQNLNTFTDCWF